MRITLIIIILLFSLFTNGCSFNNAKNDHDSTNKKKIDESSKYRANLPRGGKTLLQGNHSIVVLLDKSTGYLLGGVSNGKWVNLDYAKYSDLAEDQKLDLNFIKEGETYKLYSFNKYLGERIGSDATVHHGPGDWVGVDFKPALQDDSQVIAISAIWNCLPRVPRIQEAGFDQYNKLVSEILVKQGFQNAKIQIRQVLRIDLEGDGTEEVLISATNLSEPLDVEKSKGTYSILLLRKIVDGEVLNIILKEVYYTKDGEFEDGPPEYYDVPFTLDANGDGVMELFVEGHYYEGVWTEVIKIEGKNIKKVLTNGVGA